MFQFLIKMGAGMALQQVVKAVMLKASPSINGEIKKLLTMVVAMIETQLIALKAQVDNSQTSTDDLAFYNIADILADFGGQLVKMLQKFQIAKK